MRFPRKIFLILPVTALIAAIAVMWLLIIFDPVPPPSADLPQEILKVELLPDSVLPAREVNFSAHIPGDTSPVENSGGDLALQLQQAAEAIVLALLPENTEISTPNTPGSLKLVNSNTALVTGIAVLPPDGKTAGKSVEYQVRVNFLPGGGCEAEFPEIRILSDRR